MTIADSSTPVVVFPSPHHGGVGITRSLGRLGVPVFNVDPSRWAPALFSRYCREKFVRDLGQVADDSVSCLLGIARKAGRRCILIPTTDRAAIFVADHAADLQEGFIFPVCGGRIIQTLCQKKEMYSLAATFQVPVPETHSLRGRADLLACLKNIDLPIIVKGINARPRKFDNRTKLIIRTRRQLLDLYECITDEDIGELIVQEYISGNEDTVWMFNGYFNQDSECLASFTGRKFRQCPAYTGVTSLGVCQYNPVVEDTASRFMQALGYRGMVDIDFRYDARAGAYKVLDVNPRIGSTFRLFASPEGLDVVRALYLDLTGQPVPSARAEDGRKWMVEDLDMVGSWRYFRDGVLTLREWLGSFRGTRESAFLAFDDPLPLLMMLRADLLEVLRRVKPRSDRVPPPEPHDRAVPTTSTFDEKTFAAE